MNTFASKSRQNSTSLTTVGLVCCLLAIGLVIQSSESKDSESFSREGKPCICNSTFYKHCPKASECLETGIELTPKPRYLETPSRYTGYSGFIGSEHDPMDPDHVDITPKFADYSSGKSVDLTEDSDVDRIVRHRKVYVAARKHDQPPMVQRIKIRIPLILPTIKPANIPEPKPMYRFKTYTTYENKPEIQMVPVTKTIIKPVGVSKDQIIGDSISEPFR